MSKIGETWNKGRYVKIGFFKLLAELGAVLVHCCPLSLWYHRRNPNINTKIIWWASN